jgi:hypothetical protein
MIDAKRYSRLALSVVNQVRSSAAVIPVNRSSMFMNENTNRVNDMPVQAARPLHRSAIAGARGERPSGSAAKRSGR